MISKGSSDTEDWRDDADISALHHRNNLQFFKIVKILLYFDLKS